MCTRLRDWIWDTEQGFRLVQTGLQLQAGTSSFIPSPSHSIEEFPQMTYFEVWGHGKQARITRLHCTCPAVRASSCSGESTSGGGQACRSALYGGGRAWGGRTRYREYVETRWILRGHGAMRVRHRLPWCWHRWAFYIGCDPAGGLPCQKGHNLQVRSLDTRTRNRHAARDDVGLYTQGNLQATLLKPVCNASSCHRHRERCNTRSRRWDFVLWWDAGVPAGVLHSAPLGLFATAHLAASEEYCCSWSESAGEWPLRRFALRSSGRSSMIDCQLSYMQGTLSCHQQNSRDVFRRTWRSREPVYPPVWALSQPRLARYYPGVSLLTCVSHHQSAVCITV